MEVEIADDLFHVSFGIIRQLGKDLPHHWTQQNQESLTSSLQYDDLRLESPLSHT